MGFSRKPFDPKALALAVLTLAFPLVAALGIRWFGPWPMIGLLTVLLLARVLGAGRSAVPTPMTGGLLVVAVLELAVAAWDPVLAARLYPVFMNAVFLVAFAATLWRGPTMIERFARSFEPDLDAHGVRYTRAVTWVWVGFFIANGAIAGWTVVNGDWTVWTLYNGVISYLLMGALFAGEFLVRRRVRAKGQAVRQYRV